MRQPGIEPGPPAWQASILPLNHWRFHMMTRALEVGAMLSQSPFDGPDSACEPAMNSKFIQITHHRQFSRSNPRRANLSQFTRSHKEQFTRSNTHMWLMDEEWVFRVSRDLFSWAKVLNLLD